MAKDTGRRPSSNDSGGRNDLLPDLTVKQVSIKRLSTAKHPVRKPSNRQVAKVRASIAKNRFVVPVLIGKDNEIVDGHKGKNDDLIDSMSQALRSLDYRHHTIRHCSRFTG